MADAETMDEFEQSSAKRSSAMTIIMIINLLAVAGVLGYLLLRDDGAAAGAAAAGESATVGSDAAVGAAGREPGPLLSLEHFIVNLADRDVDRYLKIGLTLELSGEEVTETVRKREPLVRNAIISMASSLNYHEIRSAEGKQAFRKQIATRLSGLLGAGRIVNVYFTEFVVQ